MTATVERGPADFWDKWQSARAVDGRPAPVELADAPRLRRQRSFARRTLRACFRFLITLGIGVGGTLAWQAYGDETRQVMATAYPQQLGWIAPQAVTTAPAAPDASPALAAAVPAAPPVDQQQINALSLNVAAVRHTLEQLAAQVASGQQQMSGDIAKLQASEQDILNKVSAPRPAPAAAHKPTPAPLAIAPPPAPTAPAR